MSAAELRDEALRGISAHPTRTDRSYDIPYLGGYSEDGRTIYLDRRLPKLLSLPDRRKFCPYPFLLVHERVEKWLLDHRKLPERNPYLWAHRIATAAEHQAVREAGISPEEYEAALRPWIRSADHESVTHIPPDLDLTPYRDERDRHLLAELRG